MLWLVMLRFGKLYQKMELANMNWLTSIMWIIIFCIHYAPIAILICLLWSVFVKFWIVRQMISSNSKTNIIKERSPALFYYSDFFYFLSQFCLHYLYQYNRIFTYLKYQIALLLSVKVIIHSLKYNMLTLGTDGAKF